MEFFKWDPGTHAQLKEFESKIERELRSRKTSCRSTEDKFTNFVRTKYIDMYSILDVSMELHQPYMGLFYAMVPLKKVKSYKRPSDYSNIHINFSERVMMCSVREKIVIMYFLIQVKSGFIRKKSALGEPSSKEIEISTKGGLFYY